MSDREQPDEASAAPEATETASSGPLARYVIIAAIGVAVIAAGALGWRLARGEDPEATESPTAGASACEALGVEQIALDSQTTDAPSEFCLVLEDRVELTLGVAALDVSEGISITLENSGGTPLARADSSLGADPVLTLVLDPGTYVGRVTALDGGDAPPFLVYSATFAASSQAPSASGAVTPTADACGAEVPLVTGAGEIEASSDAPFLCLELEEPTFIVAGAISHSDLAPDQGGPDLQLAVSTFDADGIARTVRANDDVYGYDPEVTVDLPAGLHLIAAEAWFGVETGDLTLYAGPAGSVMRTGEVSSVLASITASVCDGSPTIAAGEQRTFAEPTQYVCLDNPTAQRLRVEAATLGEQDLVLELVQFVDGTPVRIGWTDDSPEATSLALTDPMIDKVLPAGRIIIAVTTFFGGEAENYDLRVVLID
ncbi:hypothetical protein [Demequina sp. NBRC 110052]|uniref:hypothetical protein n=1 Tax=Demequina sp. NBRC 110052 TaxID=1570341 RepID=UPI000A03030A|nr:hypothetical protein [Demequina sp. NBRC 110052]